MHVFMLTEIKEAFRLLQRQFLNKSTNLTKSHVQSRITHSHLLCIIVRIRKTGGKSCLLT